jgi:hypothetical protein
MMKNDPEGRSFEAEAERAKLDAEEAIARAKLIVERSRTFFERDADAAISSVETPNFPPMAAS